MSSGKGNDGWAGEGVPPALDPANVRVESAGGPEAAQARWDAQRADTVVLSAEELAELDAMLAEQKRLARLFGAK